MRQFDAAPHAINSVVSDPKLDEIDRPTAVDRIAQQPGLASLIGHCERAVPKGWDLPRGASASGL
jgi:hypothetical protein